MDNSAASTLYDLLVTRDFEPELLDAAGKSVTDPAEAELFSFDYKTPEKNYGTVVVLLGAENDLEVYFGDNLGRSMEGDDKKQWYDFLSQMKTFSTRNMLSFNLQNLNRLKYTMQGMAAIKEGLFEGYYGTRKVSYSDQPKKTRLVIKHNRELGEGEARFRNIDSLYVETEDGERFRVPSRSLTHGRMIARHCAEGGNPYDAFGQHIGQLVSELNTLGRFVRVARNKGFEGPAGAMVETAIKHYGALKTKAKHLISRRGYLEARGTFDPAEITDAEGVVESIRDMFIEQSLDQRIEEALPILARLAEEESSMKETQEFECWTNKVMEGTWSLPDTPESLNKIRELMSNEMPVGPDAINATEQLHDIFGDDQLFDELSQLAKSDPDADARPAIAARASELGIDLGEFGSETELEVEPQKELAEFSGAPIGGAMDMPLEEDQTRYQLVDVKGAPEEGPIIEPPGYFDITMLPGARDALGQYDGDEYSDTLYYKDPISGGTFSFYLAFGAPRIRSVKGSIDDARMEEISQSLSKEVSEDLDTDGVMMTRSSNMSSESRMRSELNRLLELAKI